MSSRWYFTAREQERLDQCQSEGEVVRLRGMYEISQIPLGPGWLGIAPMPGRTGRYEADLGVILRWPADLVLTMTPLAELERSGAGRLEADLSAAGVAWRQIAIPDFGAPGPDAEALWREASRFARETLADGGRVLAHCHGGCGRSGTALLRLMVEAGEDAEVALARLRKVRPCAVETEAQRVWASRATPDRTGG